MNNNNNRNGKKSSGVNVNRVAATKLTNPGIIGRLEQDIQDYLHEFGFIIEREWDDVNKTRLKNKALLFTPSLYSNKNYEFNTRRHHDPLGTMHLHIEDESLLTTVGPLLRTLLRLAVHIPPQSLRAILYCDFVLDPLQKLSKMSKLQQREHLSQQHVIAAKKMVNAIHMLVRNSMGSALCLDMIIVLPHYCSRKNSDDDTTESLPLSKSVLEQAMKSYHGGYYPSIRTEERVVSESFSDGTNELDTGVQSSSIKLSVSTRMCTVRHQPLLFRWLSQIGPESAECTEEITDCICSPKARIQSDRILIGICIEKPGNLHRILMLCHHYRLLLANLVVIIPGDGERNDLRRQFEAAIEHFREAVLDQGDTGDHQIQLPTLVREDDAVCLVRNRLKSLKDEYDGSEAKDQDPSVIGIDLHSNALTLSGLVSRRSQAQLALERADAVIFGYESTGIPRDLNELLNGWVQIPSRSSINVVAAMSITFDAMFDNSS